jgi:tetratricopeptide (TPR) repeat protein
MKPGKAKLFTINLAVAVIFLACFNAHAQSEPESLFEAGVASYKEGRYQDAVDIYSDLIITVPGNAKVYKNRGVALMNLGKMENAITDFSKAIELDPGITGIYSNLGAAWHYMGEYDKAIANYDMAIREEPLRSIFYYNRGISKVATGDLSGAIMDFEKATDLDPGFETAIHARQDIQTKKANSQGITFSVQTGAFRNKAYALEYQADLIKKGFKGRLLPFFDDNGTIWYLVRCGRDLLREEAEQLETELKNEYGFDTFLCLEHAL